MIKTVQSFFYRGITRIHPFRECRFQRVKIAIMKFKELNKIQKIGSIEGAMFELKQLLKFACTCIQAEFMRCIVHQLQQLPALLDYRSSVSPGKYRSKKASDLNILLF